MLPAERNAHPSISNALLGTNHFTTNVDVVVPFHVIATPLLDRVCTDEGVQYQSQCEARCAGVDERLPECPRTCDCPTRYFPVCGSDGNTYDNGCQARCAGVEVDYRGECAPPPLQCPIDAEYINEDPEACALDWSVYLRPRLRTLFQ